MTRKNFTSLAIVVLIGLLLQVGLIFLDCPHSPSNTAVQYAKAYHKLSPSEAKWICSSACSKAADHIYEATSEAAERGFDQGYAKYALSHIETHTEYLDDTTAVVHLTAHRRLAINPLYVWVARLFRIGDSDEVDGTIRVRLEDGHWRVCRSASQFETS